MGLRVGELHRLSLLGDETDQALAAAEMRVVHGLRIEAFGGEQLERPVAPAQIERAHLRHHVGGDQHHHLVEARLRALALGHHLAQAAEQQSWGANGGWHLAHILADPGRRPASSKGPVSLA